MMVEAYVFQTRRKDVARKGGRERKRRPLWSRICWFGFAALCEAYIAFERPAASALDHPKVLATFYAFNSILAFYVSEKRASAVRIWVPDAARCPRE
jgi:hypothetical protein